MARKFYNHKFVPTARLDDMIWKMNYNIELEVK